MASPLKVVFLIDALGWRIAERFEFCRGLFEKRGALDTVLGYSSAAIPSLLSGTAPSEHGAWAMWRLADEGRSPFRYLRYLPKLPHALDWRVRNLVRHLTNRRRLIDGYYDLYEIPVHLLSRFDVALHQDPYQPGGLSRETLFDCLVSDGVPYQMWYYKTPEADNVQALLEAVSGDEKLLFLYTAELDALMHRVGISDVAVERKLRGYERFLRSVLERGERAGREVSLYVFSDHGMTDVRGEFDLWGGLRARGYEVGRDYLAFFDSTMARFWCDEPVRRAASELLRDAGAGRELGAEELESYGCNFDHRGYGDYIFLADPGVMFVPSFMGTSRVAAMHGYDPGDEYSPGSFMTNDGAGDTPGSILGVKSYLMDRISGGAS
jgi:hypothetical protein